MLQPKKTKFRRQQKGRQKGLTHNLRHAVEHGTRTVMMHNGEAIMDVSGAEKDNKTINDYLTVFNEISIECGN